MSFYVEFTAASHDDAPRMKTRPSERTRLVVRSPCP
jgi:hypothetical protein